MILCARSLLRRFCKSAKKNGTTENGDWRLLLQTENGNGKLPFVIAANGNGNDSLFFLVGKILTVFNDCCFSKRAHLWDY